MKEKEKDKEVEKDDVSTTASNENIENKEEKATIHENENIDKKEEKSSIFGKKGNKETKLKEKIEKLEEEKAELNDRYLRLFSEFDNFKKRTSREKLELLATASETVISYILPVVDDFERAFAAHEKTENSSEIENMIEGFEIIYRKLLQVLKQFHVEEIPAKGELFNTDLHEAISHFAVEKEEDKGKIVDVITKGYKIKDKVIRFSKVIVGN
ncbi:MAG TPA: nucleotide exchange factor GrpE [Bacteroidales bacterium]|nr:nucleotide exchange factor GrpE [Bacteroidales bacterium]HRT13512.1 nucleotide exchange factor GrpE [Bacteroidales bacterium]HXK73897.1 nucleotide exchange factor GrpE [Bacteroidales bacterium]